MKQIIILTPKQADMLLMHLPKGNTIKISMADAISIAKASKTKNK